MLDPAINRRRRIVHGLASNLASLANRVFVQLVQIPVLLYFWDTALVGTWLLLWTVPSYLSMSTLGFASAGGNAIAAHGVSGDTAAARVTFQASWAFVTLSGFLFCAIFLLGYRAVPGFSGNGAPSADAWFAVIWLSGYVLLRIQSSVFELAFRHNGTYPLYGYVENASALIETLVLFVAVSQSHSLAYLAALLCINRGLFTLALAAISVLRQPTLFAASDGRAIWDEFRSLLRPALGFAANPVVMTVNLQGYTVLVGALFGPLVLAAFVTVRTLVRLFDSVLNMVFNTIFYEVAYVRHDNVLQNRLFVSTSVALFWLSVLFALGCAILAQPLHHAWTHGKVEFDPTVLWLTLLAVMVRSLSIAPCAILSGTNRNFAFSTLYLMGSLVSLGGAAIAGTAMGDLHLAVLWIIPAELSQTGIAVWLVSRQFGISAGAYFLTLVSPGSIRRAFDDLLNMVRGRRMSAPAVIGGG